MICSRCGTNIDDNAIQCEYCGLKFKTVKPQAMFEENNENRQETTTTNTYTVPNSSGSEEETKNIGILVFACIISALAIGAFIYSYYGVHKFDKKYSELTNRYGLTNKEIEENISGFFYRTWYLYDSSYGDPGVATCIFTEDKLENEFDGEKYTTDYKVTQISREKKNQVFTIRIYMIKDDVYISFVPYTKTDSYGNKLYDYIVSYGAENEEYIFYDRPIEQISKSDRIY